MASVPSSQLTQPSTQSREDKPLKVRCQCGAISFQTPKARPNVLFHCHCTECQRQSGSAFGTSAIYPAAGLFPLSEVLEANLAVYTREANSGRTMDCYFCRGCGNRMFNRLRTPDGQPMPNVSIKGGCVENLDWTGGKHIYVCSAVLDIPAEWEQYQTMP